MKGTDEKIPQSKIRTKELKRDCIDIDWYGDILQYKY
jgi:hypothetical protein